MYTFLSEYKFANKYIRKFHWNFLDGWCINDQQKFICCCSFDSTKICFYVNILLNLAIFFFPFKWKFNFLYEIVVNLTYFKKKNASKRENVKSPTIVFCQLCNRQPSKLCNKICILFFKHREIEAEVKIHCI